MAPASTTTRTLSAIATTGFVANDAITPDIKIAVKWSCKDGNLSMLRSATLTAKNTDAYVKAISSTGYLIPAVITPGQTWSEKLGIETTAVVSGKNPGTLDQKNDTQIDCKAEGKAGVSVPAGKFTADKVTCNYTINTITTINDAVGSPVTNKIDITDWYVSGVGSVKTVKTGDIEETHDLVSYSIP